MGRCRIANSSELKYAVQGRKNVLEKDHFKTDMAEQSLIIP